MFVHFPHKESSRMRKLSRPWFGPYRICSRDTPNVTVTQVYFPRYTIQVQLNCVAPCPLHLPAGFYWYGPRYKSPDKPPGWVEDILCDGSSVGLRKTSVHVAREVPDNLRSAETAPEEDTHVEQKRGMGTLCPPDADPHSEGADTDRETGGTHHRDAVTDPSHPLPVGSLTDSELAGAREDPYPIESPTDPGVAGTRKVYPLQSRQRRQARGELFQGKR